MRQFVVTVCALLSAAFLGSGLPSVEKDRRCGGSNPVATSEDTGVTRTLEPTTTTEMTTPNNTELCTSQGSEYTYCEAFDLCLYKDIDTFDSGRNFCFTLSDKPMVNYSVITTCFPNGGRYSTIWALGMEHSADGLCRVINIVTLHYVDCDYDYEFVCNVEF